MLFISTLTSTGIKIIQTYAIRVCCQHIEHEMKGIDHLKYVAGRNKQKKKY